MTLISGDYSASEVSACNSYWSSRYPQASRQGDCTYKYNCHSYAWHNPSTSNNVWVGYETATAEDKYWTDGSYVLIVSTTTTTIPSVPDGTKVSYTSDNHSAVKVSSTQFRSKWGPGPLMLHTPGYSPYNSSTFSYYRLASTCPSNISGWKGEYWNNRTLSGTPWLCRDDASVDFNWGTSNPQPGTAFPSDNFSARWVRTVNFSSSGTYRFTLGGDDGVRLWVDGVLIIDQWRDQPYTTYTADRYLSAGNHTIRVEYYERGGNARVYLTWVKR